MILCLLLINAEKAFWLAITYALVYTCMVPYGLFFMIIIFLVATYSVAVAFLTVLSLYHQIPLYNELTITSRPNIIIIQLVAK